ncbi:MAG TPA: hypothetical protein VGJ96_09095 [Gemmatimonadaceae bacterium]|jgi:hypothetical protein
MTGHPVSIYEREDIVAPAFRETSGLAPMRTEEAVALADGGGIFTKLLMPAESQQQKPAKKRSPHRGGNAAAVGAIPGLVHTAAGRAISLASTATSGLKDAYVLQVLSYIKSGK